ncbi:pyridoxal-dependent decarboxylase [Escherichia coli]|nr:pyridoxal-dependent decarboxylase [Escherichia coli]
MFNVDYLGGQMGLSPSISPGGSGNCTVLEFLRLGREGYTKVQNASYQVAAYLADEIAKLGPYEFICTGRPDEEHPGGLLQTERG